MRLRMREKVLVGAGILAAIGSGVTAAGVLDGLILALQADQPQVALAQARPAGRSAQPALSARSAHPAHAPRQDAKDRADRHPSSDGAAGVIVLQAGWANFGELWGAASR